MPSREELKNHLRYLVAEGRKIDVNDTNINSLIFSGIEESERVLELVNGGDVEITDDELLKEIEALEGAFSLYAAQYYSKLDTMMVN